LQNLLGNEQNQTAVKKVNNYMQTPAPNFEFAHKGMFNIMKHNYAYIHENKVFKINYNVCITLRVKLKAINLQSVERRETHCCEHQERIPVYNFG